MDGSPVLTLADAGIFSWILSLLHFRLVSCLALAVALFSIGVFGVLARRNILVMLISIEVMLNAVMLVFISFARAHANLALESGKAYAGESGQLFALFIIAVAAVEAAVGLAIAIAYFRTRETLDTREIRAMRR